MVVIPCSSGTGKTDPWVSLGSQSSQLRELEALERDPISTNGMNLNNDT